MATQDLMRLLGFDEHDLAANREGQLSQKQQQIVRRYKKSGIIGWLFSTAKLPEVNTVTGSVALNEQKVKHVERDPERGAESTRTEIRYCMVVKETDLRIHKLRIAPILFTRLTDHNAFDRTSRYSIYFCLPLYHHRTTEDAVFDPSILAAILSAESAL